MANRLRSRLSVRLYLAGVAQLVSTGLLMFAMSLVITSPVQKMLAREGRFVADGLCAHTADAAALALEVERVHRALQVDLEISGKGVESLSAFTNHARPSRPADASVRCESLVGGREAVVSYWLSPPDAPPGFGLGFPAILLLVVAGPAWVTARTIVRPLARLAAAADAFGRGDLRARVGMTRSDELGDVATAFDSMADNIVALRSAEKELLANVSHELRTPLARIRVALDLASEGAQLERESLSDVARDLAELERIVGDVLATARLTTLDVEPRGAWPLRLEPTDVPRIVDAAAVRFRAVHPARPLSVGTAAHLPVIIADGALLRRVLENLLDNAEKYTDDGSAPIAITAAADDEWVSLEVSDSGIGIATEDLTRVFEPFFRSDRSRSRATGGLGLGLALARRIVEAHGGTVRVSSRLGHGTRVQVSLPIKPPTP